MNKLAQLEAKYAELGAEIEKLKAEKTEWPKVKDSYFAIDASGIGVHLLKWCGDANDRGFLNIGNCFRTREEAEAERDARLVVAELKRQPGAKKFDPSGQMYGFKPNLKFNMLSYGRDFSLNFSWYSTYFDSEESCKKAIVAVGEDRILKAARWWAMGEV